MAHSKRNTSLAFFTSYERSLLKGDYGKQRTRLTRDSFKAFDACNLCLMRAREPVACPQGDLFCRECVVENLLAQRKEIKRMQTELDRRMQDDEEQRMLEEEEAKQKAVKDFELLQMGLEIRNSRQQQQQAERRNIVGKAPPRVVGRENGKIVLEEDVEASGRVGSGGGDDDSGDGGTKRKFELDEEELMRLARDERKKAKAALAEEKTKASTAKLPSFWVPSLTPSVASTDIVRKPPKLHPVCPASARDHIHYYSLKTLVSAKFTEAKDEKTIHGDSQRICPACKKGLNNAVKAVLAKPCGHVVCKLCADKFMTAKPDNPHDAAERPAQCYVCEADVSGRDTGKPARKDKDRLRPGLVLIQSDGTGFSAGGGNVMTEKQGIAFQC